MRTSALFAALALAASASAKTIVVTVRTNLTYNGTGDGDASGVFRPQQIDAQVGDQLLFNFTRGNHSVIQSTFDQPCVPISEHNTTVNGFNTGYRDTNNGTAITDFLVDITPEWENQTIWFYDGNTCGGVGAVNVNGTSWETFDGYVRNARRLFGPDKAKPAPSTTKKPSSTGGSPQGTDTPEDSVVRAASFSAVAVLAATLALVL